MINAPDVPVLSRTSEYWEKCARHTAKYTARKMHYMFLCDPCRERLVSQALNDRPPVYCDTHMQGFCGLCNELLEVRFCQWFLCPICANVLSAYQKALVSAQAVLRFWAASVQPHAPAWQIEETDPVYLSPFARKARTKRQESAVITKADFLASERVDGVRVPRFHIELKAGPGAIGDMSEFQLDVNDFNDIVGPALNTGLPIYVFHVQLALEYLLPTRRAAAVGLWWTDLRALSQRLKRRATRRDEAKAAVYFEPDAFRPKDEFLAQVLERRYEDLQQWQLADPPSLI